MRSRLLWQLDYFSDCARCVESARTVERTTPKQKAKETMAVVKVKTKDSGKEQGS